MPTERKPAGTEITHEFATALQQLRATAGDPSYRAMAKRSGCISHTALHGAVSGRKFPSWETTREFVAACGGDIEEWQQRWTTAAERIESPTPATRRHRQGPKSAYVRISVAAVAVFVVAAVGASIAALAHPRDDRESEELRTPEPTVEGDAIRLTADITLTDGETIPQGQKRIKTWEFENTGSVTWVNRQFRRIDEDSLCRSPQLVEIGTTPPGDRVRVSVEINTPRLETDCLVHWKMVDQDGNTSFPGNRPVYYQVEVR